MNWVDTPLLVYAAVDGHPALRVVREVLDSGAWGSSVVILAEFYQALVRNYLVDGAEATARAERLANGPGHWASLDVWQARATFAMRQQYHIDSADAILLHLAEADRGTLLTTDRRLLRAAEALGIAVRNPIMQSLAIAVAHWEEQHLPRKGVNRLLVPVERWLRRRDAALADELLEATANLSELPA
jgi:predicted nucleic acid-binding protein